MELNKIPDPRLDPALEQGKHYKGCYWVNWQNWNIDDQLDNTVSSMLIS